MDRKKATIKDIARELKITPSAVSKAMSGHPRISEVTRRRVLAVAKQLNYKPNRIATGLRNGQSKLLSIVVPSANITFFSNVIKGIEDEVGKSGYSVLVAQSNDAYDKEKRNIETVQEVQVEGVMASIASGSTTFDHYKELIQKKVPLVLFDRIQDLGVSTVETDDYKGAVDVVLHLIDQGCRRVIHLAGYEHVLPYHRRIMAFKNTMEDHGLAVHDEDVIQSFLTYEDGRRIALDLLSRNVAFDALFCASDESATGVLQVFNEKQIPVPDKIAVVGFSNDPYSSFLSPALSTVEQHSEEMGKKAAQVLLKQLNNPLRDFEPEKIVLKPELIIRNSSLFKKD